MEWIFSWFSSANMSCERLSLELLFSNLKIVERIYFGRIGSR